MARTILHIGLPRTASTFFQKRVFPAVQGFHYLGPDITQYHPYFQRLLYQDDTLWRADLFYQEFPELQGKNILLSNELFSGQGLYLAATNRTRTALRLSAAFPGAEVLLLLRNQAELLESLYCIGIYSGFTMRYQDFIHHPDSTSDAMHPLYPTFAPGEYLDTYLYTPVIKLYKEHFSNVHVLFYEDFAADRGPFLEKLSTALQIDISEKPDLNRRDNPSISSKQIGLYRVLNLWKPLLNSTLVGKLLWKAKFRFIERTFSGGKRFQFDAPFREKIQSYYQQDNRALLQYFPEGTHLPYQ